MTGITSTAGESSGAVLTTLLVSDLVNSTKMVEELGDQRAFDLFGRHDRIARDLLEAHTGREIDKTDGFLLIFERPIDAVRYATAYHHALAELSLELAVEVSSRVGIHLGEVYLRENSAEDVARGAKPLEVEGLAKPVAARIMSLAQGRQTLLSRGAFDLARRAAVGRSEDDADLVWMAHGAYRAKGVDEPMPVFEVGVEGFSPLSPPPDTAKVHRVVEDETILGWRPAPEQVIPHRPNWRLGRKLGEGGFGEVWLAQHDKTRDQRVFKFCFDHERLQGLQREVTLFRLLKETLGTRDDIARILDWNFDKAPFFVESEYTEGGSLLDWAQAHDGIGSLSMAQRLEVIAQVADALAAAHSVGVLHKDLKPGNVLVRLDHQGEIRARLTDFGIGMVTDRSKLAAAGITMLGFNDTAMLDEASATGGTQLYMAPELLEGQPASVQADTFALGVMLYQLVVGNLKHALAPGWEREVDDELLREEIASLVDGDPGRRERDASEVARRVRHMDERRRQRDAQRQAERDAAATQAALAASRRRQRIGAVVLVVVAVFAVAMGFLSWRIHQEKQRAEQAAETSRRVLDYVVGLFDAVNPENARGREITVREVFDEGAAHLEEELQGQPVVRAKLADVLAGVYFKLGDYERAETLWQESITLQRETSGTVDEKVATSLVGLAGVQLSQGRLDDARGLLEQALAIRQAAPEPNQHEVAAILSNLGGVAHYETRYGDAEALFQRSIAAYEAAHGPEHETVAKVLHNLASAQRELGDIDHAEESLRRAIAIWQAQDEPKHPTHARSLVSLARILAERGNTAEAEELLQRALVMQEEVLGPDHPLVAVSLRHLAGLLADDGQIQEASAAVTRAFQIARARLGERHQLTAEILTTSGHVERVADRLDAAQQHLETALSILAETMGSDNPENVPPLCELGRVRLAQGHADEARDLLERALHLETAHRGQDHPLTVAIRAELEAL